MNKPVHGMEGRPTRHRRLHRVSAWFFLTGLICAVPVSGIIAWSYGLFPGSSDLEFSLKPYSYHVVLWRGRLHIAEFVDLDYWLHSFYPNYPNIESGISAPIGMEPAPKSTDLDLRYPLAAIAFAWLGSGALAWLTRRPHLSGHCASCSYNLRLNTTGRCPECGSPA